MSRAATPSRRPRSAGLTVSATTKDSVSLSWSASTDNVAVTGYDVYRNGVLAGNATGRTFTDTGLAAATEYTYAVAARDAGGNTSALSDAVLAKTKTGGSTGTGAVKVQYKNTDSSASDNQIRLGLQVVNTGSAPVDLSTVKVRYWFTADGGPSTFGTYCDYAALGSSTVTHTVVAVSSPRTGADRYLEVGFTGGAGTLAHAARRPVRSSCGSTRATGRTSTRATTTAGPPTPPTRTPPRSAPTSAGALAWGVEP